MFRSFYAPAWDFQSAALYSRQLSSAEFASGKYEGHNTITNVENVYVNIFQVHFCVAFNLKHPCTRIQIFLALQFAKKFLSVPRTFQQTKVKQYFLWPVAIPLLIYIFYAKFLPETLLYFLFFLCSSKVSANPIWRRKSITWWKILLRKNFKLCWLFC